MLNASDRQAAGTQCMAIFLRPALGQENQNLNQMFLKGMLLPAAVPAGKKIK
ncbi:hypothetical protein [Pontibacter liquoris]|uniref:hypothetical protein n=1 Tax=Pontibacter liquoris TaxID=2905677 RepID=UPI001FA7605E|nr:hypothetical protein [Pontibacter liquoris]